jgi:hypothetical protein
MTTTPTPSTMPPPALWTRVPGVLVAALATAVAGFFVHVTFTSTRTVDGEITQCSYLDVGAIALGVVTALLVLATLARHRRTVPRLRLPVPLLAAASVVLLAVAVLHVLSGLGIVGGPC